MSPLVKYPFCLVLSSASISGKDQLWVKLWAVRRNFFRYQVGSDVAEAADSIGPFILIGTRVEH